MSRQKKRQKTSQPVVSVERSNVDAPIIPSPQEPGIDSNLVDHDVHPNDRLVKESCREKQEFLTGRNSETEPDTVNRVNQPPLHGFEDDATWFESCESCGGKDTVSMEYIHGVLVCEECGAVKVHYTLPSQDVEGAPYVQHRIENLQNSVAFDRYGRPEGEIIDMNKDYTGEKASTYSLPSSRARQLIQQGRPYDAYIPMKKILMAYGHGLGLPKYVLEQSEIYAMDLLTRLKGSWRRELLVTAALYIAIRMNQLPLTLLDVMAQCTGTGISVYSIGKHYRTAVQMLGLRMPMVEYQILLPKLLDSVINSAPHSGNPLKKHKVRSRVISDAEMMLQWVSKREFEHVAHPLTLASASLVLALEMNQLHLCSSVDTAASIFGISSSALTKRIRSIKQTLLSYGSKYLSFGENITMKNVSKYASIILKVTCLPSVSNSQIPSTRAQIQPHLEPTVAATDIRGHEEKSPEMNLDDVELDVDEYIRSEEEVALLEKLHQNIIDN